MVKMKSSAKYSSSNGKAGSATTTMMMQGYHHRLPMKTKFEKKFVPAQEVEVQPCTSKKMKMKCHQEMFKKRFNRI